MRLQISTLFKHSIYILSAYELYADPEGGATLADSFKKTFSNDVKVHFVGAWWVIRVVTTENKTTDGALGILFRQLGVHLGNSCLQGQ